MNLWPPKLYQPELKVVDAILAAIVGCCFKTGDSSGCITGAAATIVTVLNGTAVVEVEVTGILVRPTPELGLV